MRVVANQGFAGGKSPYYRNLLARGAEMLEVPQAAFDRRGFRGITEEGYYLLQACWDTESGELQGVVSNDGPKWAFTDEHDHFRIISADDAIAILNYE